MSSTDQANAAHGISPDLLSHTTNIYDNPEVECEQPDEENDDDMDFEPVTDSEEDLEFFDLTEDVEAEFHGKYPSYESRRRDANVLMLSRHLLNIRCRRWTKWCRNRIFNQ